MLLLKNKKIKMPLKVTPEFTAGLFKCSCQLLRPAHLFDQVRDAGKATFKQIEEAVA